MNSFIPELKNRFDLVSDILHEKGFDRSFSLKTYFWLILAFSCYYGMVMGSYGGWSGVQKWQVFYSAVKMPILILCSFAVSIPSFYVLNVLFGLHRDFPLILKGLLESQAGFAVVLASLSPYTVFWYVSFDHYGNAVLFNGFLFGIATLSGHFFLKRFYEPFIRKNRTHLWMKRLWIVLYSFVGIQMGWILRPFIGDPSLEPVFIRAETWSNAYVVVFNLVWGFISRILI